MSLETLDCGIELPDFNQLVGNGDTVPGFADRLMPSPVATQVHLSAFDLGGFFNHIDDDKKRVEINAGLHPLSETEKAAAKKEIMQWLFVRHRMIFSPEQTDPEWVILSSSTTQDILSLMEIYNEQCNGAARFGAITPTYPDVLKVCSEKYNGCSAIAMQETEQGWQIDSEAFDSLIQNMDVLFLSNPNNPNGHVFSEAELRHIVRGCKTYGVKIISDEVWADQVLSEKKHHIPLINVAQKEDYAAGVSILYGVGKTFNTSAFPCSVAIIPNQKTRAAFEKSVKKPSSEAVKVAIDCMQDNGAFYVDALNGVIKENMNYACATLGRIGMPTHSSDATTLLFVDVRSSPRAVEFFERADIGIQKGERYGMPGYVRLTVGCPPQMFRRHYDRLVSLFEAA